MGLDSFNGLIAVIHRKDLTSGLLEHNSDNLLIYGIVFSYRILTLFRVSTILEFSPFAQKAQTVSQLSSADAKTLRSAGYSQQIVAGSTQEL